MGPGGRATRAPPGHKSTPPKYGEWTCRTGESSWHPNGQPNDGPVKKKFAPPRKSNISLERVLRGFGNWPAIAMIPQLRQQKVGKR